MPEYTWERARQLEMFASTNNPLLADWLAKASLLLPGDAGVLAHADRLSEIAVSGDSPYLHWFHLTRALSLHRQGRSATAVPLIVESLKEMGGAGRASCHFLLAMCHQNLGRTEDARTSFAEGTAVQRTAGSALSDPTVDGIENWLVTELLRREAERLLQSQ